MEEFHQPRQVGLGEIVGAHPGVELVEAEVNRVRAILDGGFDAVPIAGGREQFGQVASCGLQVAGFFGCGRDGHFKNQFNRETPETHEKGADWD